MLRTGLIGMGNMGCQYASLILKGAVPDMELTAVTRIGKGKEEWARRELPEAVTVFQTGKELIEQAEVDAVIIATPHYAHESDAVMALKKGLHVLCEKPLGVYTLQAEHMAEQADRCGRVFAVMFQHRTDPMYIKLHGIIQSGVYGKLRRVNWIATDWYREDSYYRSGSWRATWAGEGGGVLLNQSIHNLDILQWLCGMPERVMAFCSEGKWHDIEVEDEATAYLEFPGGATGLFTASTGDFPGVNRLEIDLDDAQIICENREIFIQGSKDKKKRLAQKFYYESRNNLHETMLGNFAAAVQGREKLIVSGREGINSLMLVNALYLSSWQKKMKELPVDGAEFFNELKKKNSMDYDPTDGRR